MNIDVKLYLFCKMHECYKYIDQFNCIVKLSVPVPRCFVAKKTFWGETLVLVIVLGFFILFLDFRNFATENVEVYLFQTIQAGTAG